MEVMWAARAQWTKACHAPMPHGFVSLFFLKKKTHTYTNAWVFYPNKTNKRLGAALSGHDRKLEA